MLDAARVEAVHFATSDRHRTKLAPSLFIRQYSTTFGMVRPVENSSDGVRGYATSGGLQSANRFDAQKKLILARL